MKILIKPIPVLLFFIVFFYGRELVSNQYEPFLYLFVSGLFIYAHTMWAKNRVWTGLSLVVLITIIFPIAVLYLIGAANGMTFQEFIVGFIDVHRRESKLVGLELFFPLISAVIVAYFVKVYNKSLKARDALKRAP